jgi:hypothetical protein
MRRKRRVRHLVLSARRGREGGDADAGDDCRTRS